MKKLLFTLLISVSISYAGIVDAIALVVNDDPITLYDIEKKKSTKQAFKRGRC